MPALPSPAPLAAVDDPFHLLHILHRRRKILIAILRNKHIVCSPEVSHHNPIPSPPQNIALTFDPYPSHLPIPLEHLLIDMLLVHRIHQIRLHNKPTEVDPRLHRHDTPRRQRAPHPQIAKHAVGIRVVRPAARVMRVHAQVVPQAVREKRHARALREDVRLSPLQDPQTEQALDRDLVRPRVHGVPHHARRDQRRALPLHPQHDVVHRPALRREAAPHGERPRDVGGIAAPLGARVQQQVQLPGQRRVVPLVMQRRGVGARGDDGVVGLLAGAERDAALEEDGVELALVGRAQHGAQHGGVGGGGDGVGVADERDLVRVFHHAAGVDGGFEPRGVGALEGEEGDCVGDLRGDGPRAAAGAVGAGIVRSQDRVDVGGEADVVDVVELESLRGGDG